MPDLVGFRVPVAMNQAAGICLDCFRRERGDDFTNPAYQPIVSDQIERMRDPICGPVLCYQCKVEIGERPDSPEVTYSSGDLSS